ncbi:MAG: adenylosuccinate synthetase [Nanoarchaeota archaeon]|nr:adenylosuccinate synthetase [Nanoarchaeota archaeon]MBU1643523.1 adenylosuccinate synthetase [Nanoarchaeota archaeon]MBU1977367.1 adenylosuccinate synthetase [Nanoarchaeota archaeon]
MSLFQKDLQNAYWRRKLQSWKAIKDISKIPELDMEFDGHYSIASTQKALEDIIEDAQIIVVAGAYFGDEAKGKVTDAISSLEKVKAVARVNSGANAGHTVYHNNTKLVFHVLPSAVTGDKACFVGPELVVDPVSLMDNEVQQLIDNNVSYDHLAVGNFYITTPYHRIMDLMKSVHNSSTGVGIAPTHASKMWKTTPRLDDLFNSESHQRKVFEKDLGHYLGFMAERNLNEEKILEQLMKLRLNEKTKRKVPNHLLQFVLARDKPTFLTRLYQDFVVNNKSFPRLTDVEHELTKILEAGHLVVLEGSQGYFLSNGVQQFHRYGTSPDTHASGILAASNLNTTKYKSTTINVNKFPASSRVGIGNIPGSYTDQDRFSSEGIDDFSQLEDACLDFNNIQKLYFESVVSNGILQPIIYSDSTGRYLICEAMAIASSRQFGEKGATTNKPRVTGLFDCVLESLVAKAQGPNLVISALDRGDNCDYVGLTVGYVVHLPEDQGLRSDEQGFYIFSNGRKYRSGDIIKPGDSIPGNKVLENCHSITKVMPGWKDTPISAEVYHGKEGDFLPQNVANLVQAVEHYTGFKARAIGNGVNSKDLIFLDLRNKSE